MLLVALRRALGEIAFSIGRVSSDPDVSSEILVELLTGLAISGGAPSVDLLLDQTCRNARRAIRRQERAVGREVDWRVGTDVEDLSSNVAPDASELLEKIVDVGAVRREDAELIHLTRVGGLSLSDVAKARSVRYEMIQRRRHRAEAVVREFLRKSGES